MKKIIDDQLTLFYNSLFPWKQTILSRKKHKVTIGIGGNLGDVDKRFKKLFLAFQSNAKFDIIATSPCLKNPPFGYLEQDDFLNAVMVLKTNLSPHECLRIFQRYENRYGRLRSFQDAPRTLDIDIIFFDKRKIDTKDLLIPHKGYKHRPSVQIPLKYVQVKL